MRESDLEHKAGSKNVPGLNLLTLGSRRLRAEEQRDHVLVLWRGAHHARQFVDKQVIDESLGAFAQLTL